MKNLNFINSYSELPESFFTKIKPEGFAPNPCLVHANPEVAKLINLDPNNFSSADFALYFSGKKNLQGSDPLAMVYSGHQFGVWAGQLGDGRALLLGQVQGQDNKLYDIQLKGSGVTPYSRMGDGRAVLRSCLREYLCSEAMYALGIPTTRALCVVSTGEKVQRETWEPGAILTRVAESHIRFGHFEHFFWKQDTASIKILADYVIEQHFSGLSYRDWFAEVVKRTARLIAKWQAVGFAHGVMNTDNMSILGETLDYGPFGFLENYDTDFICNHSDHQGRYSFGNQPPIALWNLQALGFALQSLFSFDEAKEILMSYEVIFKEHYFELMFNKLGITNQGKEDYQLLEDLLELMLTEKLDYPSCFSSLSEIVLNENTSAFTQNEKTSAWSSRYKERIRSQNFEKAMLMKKINPRYILRNWVAETAIRAAEDRQDYSVLEDVFKMLLKPFDENPCFEKYNAPAPKTLQNLCVSCSS